MYFKEPGSHNTKNTLKLAFQTAKARGIKDIVIATTKGDTIDLIEQADGLNIVVVTHVYGMKEPGKNSLSEEKRTAFLEKGYRVCTAAHVLSGAERSLSLKYGGVFPVEIIAQTLRFFGEGTKVCVEIAAMAADAGYIQPNTPVVAIAGTAFGADTAIILRAAHTRDILKTKIDEFICKPIEP